MRTFDAISLFSGAMGLDLGLEQVGRLIGDCLGPVKAQFVIKACVESDRACQDAIRRNIAAGRTVSENLRLYHDIRRIQDPCTLLEESNVHGELPLIVGGPPCQPFSTAGRRGTVQDARGTLLWEFLRFVKELRPQFFLMENVRGLRSAAISHRPIRDRGPDSPPLSKEEKPGSVLRLLLTDFERLGYRVDVFEVNAVNYGAPQLRERMLLIGNKYNLIVNFPQPTHGPVDQIPQKSLFSKDLLPFRTLGDAIGNLHEERPVLMDFSPRKKKYLSMVPPGGNWRCLPKEIQRHSMGRAWFAKGGRSGWWRRLTFDLPCPCLVTMPNHAGTSLCHPIELRVLSVREYARIQEFPDDWEVCGTPAEQYMQLGNAVPVRLGEVAGKVLGDCILSIGNREEVKPGQKITPSRKVYIKSHVRTRRWYGNGQAIVRPVAPLTMEGHE